MRSARDNDGFALVTAIILLSVMMGLGLGLLLLTDNQQKASAREQASESAFNVAEAALNAQIGQISRLWPGNKELAEKLYPTTGCTAATSTATNGCPATESLKVGYPSAGTTTCPASQKDHWESPDTNEWTTYVRDDGPVGAPSQIFNSEVEKGLPSWDANGDEKLWVRSVGVVQCRVVTLITLVSEQLVAVNFPHNAATGNWFKVTNNGNKVIVNTEGEAPYKANQPGEISMRCEGVSPCEEWDPSKEQISPNTTKGPPSPSPTYSSAQLAAFKVQAQAAGSYHSPTTPGGCPSSTSEISGMPAYVEGCGEVKLTGGIGNSAATPGVLILADGTLEFLGNAEFYGAIYARNPLNLSIAVISLGGTAQIKGAIDVDGKGGIEFGSSKANLIFDPRAFEKFQIYAGATPTRNSFRVLPITE